jgi:predicted nucleic acid-binding protein
LSCYIDTSVLAAFYCPEPLSEAVDALLTSGVDPAISALTEVELYSAVARKVRLAEMREVDARGIIGTFRGHLDGGYYRRIAIRAEHYEDARDGIATLSVALRSLDALHLGVALREEMELVTADAGLATAMRSFGGAVRLLTAG